MGAKTRIDLGWEQTDPHYSIKQVHGALLVDRLTKLISAGYRLDKSRLGGGDIPLIHPSKKVPDLALWDDGLVNDLYPSQFRGRDDRRTIFEPEDSVGFEQFVASVPAHNFFERFRLRTIEEASLIILAWTLFGAFAAGFSKLAERFWDWMRP